MKLTIDYLPERGEPSPFKMTIENVDLGDDDTVPLRHSPDIEEWVALVRRFLEYGSPVAAPAPKEESGG